MYIKIESERWRLTEVLTWCINFSSPVWLYNSHFIGEVSELHCKQSGSWLTWMGPKGLNAQWLCLHDKCLTYVLTKFSWHFYKLLQSGYLSSLWLSVSFCKSAKTTYELKKWIRKLSDGSLCFLLWFGSLLLWWPAMATRFTKFENDVFESFYFLVSQCCCWSPYWLWVQGQMMWGNFFYFSCF